MWSACVVAGSGLIALMYAISFLAGEWTSASDQDLDRLSHILTIWASSLTLTPAIAVVFAGLTRNHLRAGIAAAFALAAVVGIRCEDEPWRGFIMFAVVGGVGGLVIAAQRGRRAGAVVAIPAISSIVLAMVATISQFVFESAATTVLTTSIEWSGMVYWADPAEVDALGHRVATMMKASGSAALIAVATIWCAGMVILMSFHQERVSRLLPRP